MRWEKHRANIGMKDIFSCNKTVILAASEMKKAKDLYHQQANLNGLYRQAVSDRDRFKSIADKAAELYDFQPVLF